MLQPDLPKAWKALADLWEAQGAWGKAVGPLEVCGYMNTYIYMCVCVCLCVVCSVIVIHARGHTNHNHITHAPPILPPLKNKTQHISHTRTAPPKTTTKQRLAAIAQARGNAGRAVALRYHLLTVQDKVRQLVVVVFLCIKQSSTDPTYERRTTPKQTKKRTRMHTRIHIQAGLLASASEQREAWRAFLADADVVAEVIYLLVYWFVCI